MQPLFNKRLRLDCSNYLPTETPGARICVPRQRGTICSATASPATSTVEDGRSSVDYKGRLVKFQPQPIDRLQNSRSTQQLLFQAALTGKVKEHDSQQNRQQTLSRHAWNRQQNTKGDQQDAKSVFANNSRSMKGRMTSRQEVSLVTTTKIVVRQLDENKGDDAQIDNEGNYEDQDSD